VAKATHRNSVLTELDRFLAKAELEGADAVRAALARRLAEELDNVPPYALPRLASALVRLLETMGTPATGDAGRAAARLVRQVARG
jgi:hypothetical protein